MANPLFQLLSGNQTANNPFEMIRRFNEFRKNFSGDPQQMVQQLLQSGRMTQQQYNQLSQMASEFQRLLH